MGGNASASLPTVYIPGLYPRPAGLQEPTVNPPISHENHYVTRGPPDNSPYNPTSAPTNNLTDRFESFLLLPGEKKIETEVDTRVPNCVIFHFKKEDHTLGNVIRDSLLRNQKVLFAGYKVPHPLFPDFDLRVQTDGSISPKEAVITACRETVRTLEVVKQQFTREWELKKIAKTHEAAAAAANGDSGHVNGIGPAY